MKSYKDLSEGEYTKDTLRDEMAEILEDFICLSDILERGKGGSQLDQDAFVRLFNIVLASASEKKEMLCHAINDKLGEVEVVRATEETVGLLSGMVLDVVVKPDNFRKFSEF